MKHMTYEMLKAFTYCAENKKDQTLVEMLIFTFCSVLGLCGVTTIVLCASAKLGKKLFVRRPQLRQRECLESAFPLEALTPLTFFLPHSQRFREIHVVVNRQ